MLKLLAGLVTILFSTIVFILPPLKRKNDELNKQVERKDSIINSVKENEKIKSDNSKLSKSDLINKL